MARLSLAEVANRVATIESELKTMKQAGIDAAHQLSIKLTEIETTNREILDVVQTAKTASRYLRRWAGPVIASAATAGFFNPKVTTFLTALFS